MSNPQENASVAAPENEETVETPETPVTDEATGTVEPESQTPSPEAAGTVETVAEPQEATTAPEESSGDDQDAAAEATEEPSDEEVQETYVEREALVAPDLSDLPDDIGDDFEKAIEATVLEFREGDIVEGTIVSVDSEGALVDIGYKSEGFIPTRELSIRNNVDPENTVEIGDRVESVVLDKEDDEGRLILSKKRAMYERAWGQIQKIADEDGTVEGTVIEVVKGGLIVDIGLRGFLPASLVDLRRVRDLDPFIGDTITAKVIELDRARNNVVLSRRAHLEEALAEERTEFLDNLHEGEVRDGTVSSMCPSSPGSMSTIPASW